MCIQGALGGTKGAINKLKRSFKSTGAMSLKGTLKELERSLKGAPKKHSKTFERAQGA